MDIRIQLNDIVHCVLWHTNGVCDDLFHRIPFPFIKSGEILLKGSIIWYNAHKENRNYIGMIHENIVINDTLGHVLGQYYCFDYHGQTLYTAYTALNLYGIYSNYGPAKVIRRAICLKH